MATAPSPAERGSVVQLIGRLSLGIGLALLSLVVTVDQVFGSRAPEIASRWGTGPAAADAVLANRMVYAGSSPALLKRAEKLAGEALAREPVNVAALRALANVAAQRGGLRKADRLLRYSEELSRRDLLTQLWLIDERVRHEDIPGALIHYDRALRTNGRARAVLFPILVPGVGADPTVARGMERLLAQRSAWGPDFLAVMAQDPNADPQVLGRLLIAARLRPDVPAERGPLDAALARLVASGQFEAAYAAWQNAVDTHGSALVRGGDFEAAPVLGPFDWSLADTTDLSAVREPRGSGTALTLRASSGGSGDLAGQLLLLQPGNYLLRLTSAGASGDRIARAAVAVGCAGGSELVRLPLSAVEEARLSAGFTIPAGCEAQFLTIAAPAGLGGSDGVFVDDLSIVRVK